MGAGEQGSSSADLLQLQNLLDQHREELGSSVKAVEQVDNVAKRPFFIVKLFRRWTRWKPTCCGWRSILMRCGIGSVSGVRRRNQQIYLMLMIKTFYEMEIQKINKNMKRQGNHIGNSKKKNDLFKDRLLVQFQPFTATVLFCSNKKIFRHCFYVAVVKLSVQRQRSTILDSVTVSLFAF